MENNNQIFKVSREQYGDNSVYYKDLELLASNKLDRGSSLSFEWGDNSEGSEALAYAILNKVASRDIASRYAKTYMQDIISKILKDDWTLEGIVVVRWINLHTNYSIDEASFDNGEVSYEYTERREEGRRKEQRRIQREKDFKEESQRRLKIYEAKNEERRADDRRKGDRRVHSEGEPQNKLKEIHAQYQEELNTYKQRIIKQNTEIEAYKEELKKYKFFVESLDIKMTYKKYCELSL